MHFSDEAILAAAYAFEATRQYPHGESERAEIARHGFDVMSTGALTGELTRMIEATGPADSKDRCQAYWALGKAYDPTLLPFFRRQLRVELDRDIEGVYQIMIALDNLDEPVFADGGTSHSSNDYERNRDCAQRYLAALPAPS